MNSERPRVDRRKSSSGLWIPKSAIIFCVALAIAASMLISLATVLVVQNQTNDRLQKVYVNMCDGVNLLRGFARIATHGGKPEPPDENNLGDWLLRIRDCEETYRTGIVATIDADEEVSYLTALSKHKRVAVRDQGQKLVPIP